MASAASIDVSRAAQLFHALSDETRLGIIEKLRNGEQCVCDLQDGLEAAQSRLSFHLRVLKDAGLVTDRKEGRWTYYSIAPDALAEVHDLAVAMQPSKLSEFMGAVRDAFERAAREGEAPVLVTSAAIRPFVRSLVERFRAQTTVLSQAEIHPRARLKTVGSI